jgi:hypothetical protein
MALIAYKEEFIGGLSRYMPVREFDGATIRRAKAIFDDYKQRGVIVSGGFEDMSWKLSDEARKVGLTLLTFEGGSKTAMSWIGCTYARYVMYVKTYIVLNLGEISLATLQELTRHFNRLAVATVDEAVKMTEHAAHLAAFLQLIPGNNEQRDAVISELEEKIERRLWQKQKGNRRQLSDFKSYLRFHEVLANFWRVANDKQKLFFFPLYFWWNLTAILPLRPTEFLLIPRQCLETKNGEKILTIRRTVLKGGLRKLHYSIDGDYKLMKYSIADGLADEVLRYIHATDKLPLSSLNTLFVPKAHYSCLGRDVPSSSVYYSYQNLSYCLRNFQDVIMEIEPDKDRISLGDTRHLAMISLIISGGSPTICKELAGHEDITVSSNYYSNISKFIECATYDMYKKQNRSASVDMQSHRVFRVSETAAVNGGRCDSPTYISGSINDCIRSIGTNGELGDCVSCPHFIDGETGEHLLFSDSNADALKSRVDEDSKYLIRLLELVRKGRGCDEDMQSALLRLQHSSSKYSHCLYGKMGGL